MNASLFLIILSPIQVGIQDYSDPWTCPPHRSPFQRSNYSKRFVVLEKDLKMEKPTGGRSVCSCCLCVSKS